MDYIIKYVPGEPCFDTLGVMKLRCAQTVPINDRIYAQAQLGRNDDCLFIRILSFEPKPAANARLSAIFCHGGKELRLSVTADGTAAARCGTDDFTARMTAYITQGEDLQGEYWAGVLMFPLDTLLAALGMDQGGSLPTLSGNILRENPALSSAAPIDEVIIFSL